MAGELTEELAKGLPRAGCGKWLGSNGQFTSNKPLMIASLCDHQRAIVGIF